MSTQEQWGLVHSLLQGARGTTIRDFDVMETNTQEIPTKFWVEYTNPQSKNCQNLHNEIESFGYLRERADGSRWVYRMPTARRDDFHPPGGGTTDPTPDHNREDYQDPYQW